MTCTTQGQRGRRIAAAALALPLALAMTGTAFAAGSGATTAGLRTTAASASAADAARVNDAAVENASARSAAAQAAADKAAAESAAAARAAAETAAAEQAAAAKAAGDKAAAERAAEAKAAAAAAAADRKAEAAPAPRPERTATGSAAGAASGKSAAAATTTRDSSANPDKHGTATTAPLNSPQPLSKADRNGTGANPGSTCTHVYCSTRDGSASGNGNGGGEANGKPCAGCVGKADNKNPPGQEQSNPRGTFPNNGYECDNNNGIGKTNPAHTGCTSSTSSPSPAATAVDACPNKPGMQSSGPCSDNKQKDACPDKPGMQSSGPCSDDKPKDACPDMPGSQPAGTTCSSTGNNGGGNDKVTICHATGSATNPYVVITVDKNGLNGHGDHAGDKVLQPGQTAADCPAAPGGNNGGGNDKVTICHATGSATNPYVVITVDKNGLNGHGDHAGDIVPAPANGVCSTPVTPIVGGGGGGSTAPLCPNGAVMPGGNPASCPTAPPVCPTVMPLTGPVMAGCQPFVPPTQGGGGTTVPPTGNLPIGTVTPGQPAAGKPIGGLTPNQPATRPVPVGPPTGIRPNGTAPQVLTGVPAVAVQGRSVPSALPFTGTDAALLVELGALLLLVGGGVTLAARRERIARAAA